MSKSKKITSGCACMNTRSASRAITKIYDQALKSSGLKANQFSLLMVIKAKGPLNISTLGKIQNLDRTTIVRNLKPLDKEGLIDNVQGIDLRERQIVVSKKGLKAVEVALPLWIKIQKEISNHIGEDRLQVLQQISISLKRFAEAKLTV